MPGWHKFIKSLDDDQQKKVTIVGVIQEQHPERCQLFAQWKQFDWPILHDPFNSLGLRAVPVPVAIDEHGIVRDTRPNQKTFVDTFLEKQFDAPSDKPKFSKAVRPDIARMRHIARMRRDQSASDDQEEKSLAPTASQDFGDALILWGDQSTLTEAIATYHHATPAFRETGPSSTRLSIESRDAPLLFHLGVAYRMRSESKFRKEGDFANAVSYWDAALRVDPNQYIYRRRIQQYGPRLEKPYPFYDWVDQAIADIKARGETPVELRTMPTGAEISSPIRNFKESEKEQKSPDPEGKISRDTKYVHVTSVIVPGEIKPGKSGRIHVEFSLNQPSPSIRLQAHPSVKWNNEAEPMAIWMDAPNGWKIEHNLTTITPPAAADSDETRKIEFEVSAPKSFNKTASLQGYALYNVCEKDGRCLFLRRDFEIKLEPAK